MTKNTELSFLSRIDRRDEDGCWIWSGCKNQHGYGLISFNNRQLSAHRLSYQLFIGEIPKGMYILHKCDNPSCVNPNHLFLGTQKDNMQDMVNKGRSGVGQKRGCPKLTWDQVRTIRGESKTGKLYKIIAEEYGVDPSLISQIMLNKIWKVKVTI